MLSSKKSLSTYLLTVALCLLVTGCCTTPPQRASFPTPSTILMSEPPELETLPGDGEVSARDAAATLVHNYTTFWLVRAQLISLQEWVAEQKRLNP